MKRYPSRKPAAKRRGSEPKRRGRYGKVWLSPEFVTWCKRHHFKPDGFARCVLHTFALANPGGTVTIQGEGKPVNVDDIYDLPDDGKKSD